jgi:hypothetical protein
MTGDPPRGRQGSHANRRPQADVPEDAQPIQAKGEFVKGGRVTAILSVSGAQWLNVTSDDLVSPHMT